jgi:hypothetical protein
MIVIGAGVSGITTAIALQIIGFDVHIITKRHPFKNKPTSTFSSLFPAASIIPHAVSYPNIIDLFSKSASVFELLYKRNFSGIEKHKHFEFFTTKQDIPYYAKCYSSFELLNNSQSLIRPCHPELDSSFGWQFDCLFSDWGVYFPALYVLFQNLGGKINQKKLTADSIQQLEADCIINCAEIYGGHLLGDPFLPIIYRGHLIHIPNMPILRNEENKKISYNFTPGIETYASESGTEQDVYFYQRNDRWIFGGSRQKGTINENGQWVGENVIDPKLNIHGLPIPEQIMTLNGQIINHSFGYTMNDHHKLSPKIGYRFMGNIEECLRLDAVEIGSKLIINNFGHGGSGVTLSWGCALKVISLLSKAVYPIDMNIDKFKRLLSKYC